MAKPARRRRRAAQQRRLRERLCQQRAWRKRRHLHHARECCAPGRGIEQVVGRAAVAVKPAAPADAARGHPALRHREGVQNALVKRALHVDRAQRTSRAADREVARAVDRKAGVICQRLRKHVCEQPLGQATGVELHAGRARDARHARVGVDLAPARARAGSRRLAARSQGERQRQRQRMAQVAHVAAVLDLIQQRPVHEAARAHRREHHRLGQPRHQRADRDRAARILIQARQLAVWQKARELVVPLLQTALSELGRRAGRAPRRVALHQHLTRGAKAVK
jgi:hypothetical protein